MTKPVRIGVFVKRKVVPFAVSVGLVALAVFAGMLVLNQLPRYDLTLLFLVAVLCSAAAFGVWPGLFSAFLAFNAYNFFFVPPTYSFAVTDTKELIALGVFLFAALLTGGLAGRLKEQVAETKRRAAIIQSLYAYSGRLSGASDLDTALEIVESQIFETLGRSSAILLLSDDGLVQEPISDRSLVLSTSEVDRIRHVVKKNRSSFEIDGDGETGRHLMLVPIRGSGELLGVVAVERTGSQRNTVETEALDALIGQAAIAIERTKLAAETAEARALADQERLRSALLSSISHDLRTPLASILGSVTSIRQFGDTMPVSARDDLLGAIEEETGRLGQFVANLLAMTRLESGAIHMTNDSIDLGDSLRGAVDRARRLFPGVRIEVSMNSGTFLVRGDAVLIEQVILNLIDNAVKFGGIEKPIRILLTLNDGRCRLCIDDEGPGVPPHLSEAIFEKFRRAPVSGSRVPGTGLGLAIARGVIVAMGGSLHAESPLANGRGTRFQLSLPLAAFSLSANPLTE